MTGLDVKIWMMANGVKAREIAEERKCSESLVSRFLRGEKTSAPLAAFLIRKGCPERCFKNGRVTA